MARCPKPARRAAKFASWEEAAAAAALGPVRFACRVCGRIHHSDKPHSWIGCAGARAERLGLDILPLEGGRVALALPPVWAAWRAPAYRKVWDERFNRIEADPVALAAAPARSAWRAVRRAAEGRWRALSRITGEALARAGAPLQAAEAAAAALRRAALAGGRRRLAGESWTAEVAWGATAADGPGPAPGSWALATFKGPRGKANVWVAGPYPPQALANALSPEPPAP
jgi:hypothetical protein